MSKETVVANAIVAQLKHEGRFVIDLNKRMGKHYNYAVDTMRLYLEGLRRRLEVGVTPYFFQYDEDFVADAIGWTLGELTGEVSAATSSTKPKEPQLAMMAPAAVPAPPDKPAHAAHAAAPSQPARPAHAPTLDKPVQASASAAPATSAKKPGQAAPADPAKSPQPS